MGSEDTTIKSNWKVDKVNINYNLNGGTAGASSPTEGKYGSTVTVSKPTKTGYTFAGWDVLGTGASINDTSLTIGTSDITLTANWTINVYSISYTLNGGMKGTNAPTSGIYGTTVEISNPTKDGYIFVEWTISGTGSTMSGTNLTIGTSNVVLTAEWVEIAEYAYTGGEQSYVVPVSGYYKVETWGAQGGSICSDSNCETLVSNTYGGYGGYAVAKHYLNASDNLYVNVGGKGESSSSYNFAAAGGYNGGGGAYSQSDTKWGAGGGATHIATISGLLSEIGADNISKIVIVSGGGGGGGQCSSYYNVGGSGGGVSGNNGNGNALGKGGTQTSGGAGNGSNAKSGSFGLGGGTSANKASGGGGGLYGGGTGYSYGSSGGGGSGYIGNSLLIDKYMYCYNCATSDEESTKTYTTTCAEETPTENCAKIGDGYAKITFVGKTISE